MPTGDPPMCRCGYGPIVGCHCCAYGHYQFTPTPGPWTCPKCSSIYGPAATECYRCNPPQSFTVTSLVPTPGEKQL